MSVLLAAFERFEDGDRSGFGRFLRAIAIASFRYNVICNRQTNEQERVYNSVATRLHSRELDSVRDAIAALRPVYPEDKVLKAAFAQKEMRTTSSRNKKIVRFILFEIEGRVSGSRYDFESAQYSIEHVLPEHPEDDWTQFDDQQLERSVYRLGNMTLLSTARNREIGNRPFADKRPIYAESEFATTRKLAEDYDEWTVDKIHARQQWMASQATAIWQISF